MNTQHINIVLHLIAALATATTLVFAVLAIRESYPRGCSHWLLSRRIGLTIRKVVLSLAWVIAVTSLLGVTWIHLSMAWRLL